MRTSVRSLAPALAVALSAAAPAAAKTFDDIVAADLGFARDQLAATAATVPVDRYPSRTGPDGQSPSSSE
ncbi:MAG: hypothetical protein FJW90_11170 [Actinobacteria bacterium]|nr:hypothetical protein [Actinomycetota bacterium]